MFFFLLKNKTAQRCEHTFNTFTRTYTHRLAHICSPTQKHDERLTQTQLFKNEAMITLKFMAAAHMNLPALLWICICSSWGHGCFAQRPRQKKTRFFCTVYWKHACSMCAKEVWTNCLQGPRFNMHDIKAQSCTICLITLTQSQGNHSTPI